MLRLPALNSLVVSPCHLSGCVRTVSSAIAKPATPAKASKRQKKLEKDEATKKWETVVVKDLKQHFDSYNARLSAYLHRVKVNSYTVNQIRSEQPVQLFSFAAEYGRLAKLNKAAFLSPEFFAVILKFAANTFGEAFESRTPQEWKIVFHSGLNLLLHAPLNNDLAVMGYAAAYQAITEFHEKHASEVDFGNVQDFMTKCLGNLERAANQSNLSMNQLLFDYGDYDRTVLLRRNLGEVQRKASSIDAHLYDKDLDIVSDLRVRNPRKEYDSPFDITMRNKKDYVSAFADQLASESGGYLRVKNFTRPQNFPPMEELVKQWRWKEKIAMQLKHRAVEMRDPTLKCFLSNLDYNKVADVILDVVMAEMGQQQNLFSVPSFEYALASAILHHCYQSFLSKVNISVDKVMNGVFDKFCDYFIDPAIAQAYTMREWWMMTCDSINVDSELSLPLVDFKKYLRPKIGGIVCGIVMSSCKFPYVDKRQNVPVIRSAFFFEKVMHEEESELLMQEKKVSITKMIRIHQGVMKHIKERQFEDIRFPHEFLPMRVPPRPWIDRGRNGPFYSRPSLIIRDHPDYKDVKINDEFAARLEKPTDARPVFDALNDLGATPWIINRDMLDVLCQVFAMGQDQTHENLLKTLSIPMNSSTVVVPEYIQHFGEVSTGDIPVEKWIEFNTAKREAIKKKNETNSLWCYLHFRIALARHFQNDVLFFPHNMDFRGRVYPISPHLNHMGDDVNRCILKFAKGKPLGARGLYWLKLHTVNITGLLKRNSIRERIAYAEEHMADIIDSADRPLTGKQWWLQSEEPWQTLAACMELRNALQSPNPEEYVSHLPIHQDGSCNGLQHYAALGRDKEGALEVNLLPCEYPADVYSSVAARVEEKRLADENNPESPHHQVAVDLRQALPQALPRKVIKQTVMTTVYGVTEYGARQQIKKQLKALGADSTESGRLASYLVERTFASLHDAFTTSMAIKEWLRQSATVGVQLMKPIEWKTPLGLPVMQPYLANKSKLNKVVKLPVRHKQVNAFPPNFVHSLDSTHMMLTALHCRRHGITFAAVHDCFWTHASTVDSMNEICREQFVQMHSQPLIDQLASSLQKQLLPPDLTALMPKEDVDRFREKLTPAFKPGDLDIQEVRNSTYFFS